MTMTRHHLPLPARAANVGPRALSRVVLVVLLATFEACSGSTPTAPSPSPAPTAGGIVSALFDGAAFSAASVARATVTGASIAIDGAEGRRGLRFSFVATTPGTYAVQTAAVVDGDQTWGVGLSFGADGSGGTVVLSSLSATRATGTFQMTVVQPSTGNRRLITNGRFDVPVQ